MSTDYMDFLEESSGSAYPGFKFKNLKDGIKGRIVEKPRLVEVDDMNKPGQKVKKLVLAIEATAVQGVYGVKDDSGRRTEAQAKPGETYAVWVGKGFMAQAVNDAVKAANADGLKEGDTFSIQYVEDKDTGKPQPAKVYGAKLEPAKPTVSVGSLLGDDEPAESLL